jgi:predicted sulfurtransferase
MMSEKRANALLGYCFVFDENESVSHSRNCPAFRCSCSEMARAARDERKALQLFKNANYEIAVRLS